MAEKKTVILDCDPGHDDMIAIILATKSSNINLQLITTVSGNTSVKNTTNNALNILNYIGEREVNLAKGYDYLFAREYAVKSKSKEGEEVTGAGVHGKTGLDGFDFPEHDLKPSSTNPIEEMAKVVKESLGLVTIIATGPLTNVALFLRTYPELRNKIEKISMMGGTCDYILIHPYMEFNTYTDPEATNIVFESGIPIDMFGYDVTYTVMYDTEVLDKVKSIGNKTSKMVYDLLYEFRENHNSLTLASKFGDTAPIHDACAVAAVIDPSLVTESVMMRGEVELEGKYMRGATVFDRINKENRTENINVVYKMDNKRFFDLLIDMIRECD